MIYSRLVSLLQTQVRSFHGQAKAVPAFSFGVNSFKRAINKSKDRFFIDKTKHIKTLEETGEFVKIWRPDSFGKTTVCNMLSEYYDKANDEETLRDIFYGTEIWSDEIPKEMGKYLVLRLNSSMVFLNGNIHKNFRKNINNSVQKFSMKYYDAGFLKRLIEIDTEDCFSSMQRLFNLVEISGHQIYLIVDDCDAFMTPLLMSVRASLEPEEYKTLVSDKEIILQELSSTIKGGTSGAIGRAFFTGNSPQAFSDGQSSLNMAEDCTYSPQFEGMFGMTTVDVKDGLQRISTLTEDQRTFYLEQMRMHYGGYCFSHTQKEPMFNPRCVLYFLNHLSKYGVPPESLVESADSGEMYRVAEYLIKQHKATDPDMLQKFALSSMSPTEMRSFEKVLVPAFHSAELFDKDTVRDSLVTFAYYHGFLTLKPNPNQRSILIVPNKTVQNIYTSALIQSVHADSRNKLNTMIRNANQDLTEFMQIVRNDNLIELQNEISGPESESPNVGYNGIQGCGYIDNRTILVQRVKHMIFDEFAAVVLLTSPAATGKTSLVQLLRREKAKDCLFIPIKFIASDAPSAFQQLADQSGLEFKGNEWRKPSKWGTNKRVVITIDDAQRQYQDVGFWDQLLKPTTYTPTKVHIVIVGTYLFSTKIPNHPVFSLIQHKLGTEDLMLSYTESVAFLKHVLPYPLSTYSILLDLIAQDCGGVIGALRILADFVVMKVKASSKVVTEADIIQYIWSTEVFSLLVRCFGTTVAENLEVVPTTEIQDLLYGERVLHTELSQEKHHLTHLIRSGVLKSNNGSIMFASPLAQRYYQYLLSKKYRN